MHFRLVRPMRRKGTINHHFNQRIPADVRARAVGLTLAIPLGTETAAVTIKQGQAAIRFSLRAFDPSTVKQRQAQVLGYLESVWQALRNNGPHKLTPRQAAALAGELYRAAASEVQPAALGFDWSTDPATGAWSSPEPLEPGVAPPGSASLEGAVTRLGHPDLDLEKTFGPLVDRLLLARGYAAVDPDSRLTVLEGFRAAQLKGLAQRQRHLAGDFSPDPHLQTIPVWPEAQPAENQAAGAVSLTGLVEDWWREAKASGRSQSTYGNHKGAAARLAAFLGHDDASRVTPANIVAFKDHRLAQGISPKTVGDNDIAGLRAIFKWAVGNLRLPSNPAEKVAVTRHKAVRVRERSFTPAEAKAILSHSLHHPRGRQGAKLLAALRWVPWLCAYTGARVGEIVQLRKQDVRPEGEAWVITITPEAGTVKDKELREVVLHAHLVEQGFVDFAKAAPEGYLFMSPAKPDEAAVRGAWRTTKNRLREFAREVVKDPNVAPNHGWRHMFKTVGREVGIADSILDAICGHAAKTVGGSYGSVTLKAQRDAMERFPRFAVEGGEGLARE